MAQHGSFRPGARVPDTAIYAVSHGNQHKPAQEVLFKSGDRFPLCMVCTWGVTYAFVRPASYTEMVAN